MSIYRTPLAKFSVLELKRELEKREKKTKVNNDPRPKKPKAPVKPFMNIQMRESTSLVCEYGSSVSLPVSGIIDAMAKAGCDVSDATLDLEAQVDDGMGYLTAHLTFPRAQEKIDADQARLEAELAKYNEQLKVFEVKQKKYEEALKVWKDRRLKKIVDPA